MFVWCICISVCVCVCVCVVWVMYTCTHMGYYLDDTYRCMVVDITQYICIYNWLVVSTPLKNISQLGVWFPIYGKIKNVPNHQPDSIHSTFNTYTITLTSDKAYMTTWSIVQDIACISPANDFSRFNRLLQIVSGLSDHCFQGKPVPYACHDFVQAFGDCSHHNHTYHVRCNKEQVGLDIHGYIIYVMCTPIAYTYIYIYI